MLKRFGWAFALSIVILLGIAFFRSQRAFSQGTNNLITPIAQFRVAPSDGALDLKDVTTQGNSLYFLFSARNKSAEVVQTDGSGSITSRTLLTLPSSLPARTLRVSEAGVLALLDVNGSKVSLYSPAGSLLDKIEPSEPLMDIQFVQSSLFGFGYGAVVRLYPTSNPQYTAITTNVYTPFKTVRLPNNSFGLLCLTKGTLIIVDEIAHNARSLALGASFPQPVSSASNGDEFGLILSASAIDSKLFCLLTGFELSAGALVSVLDLTGKELQTFRCALPLLNPAPVWSGPMTHAPYFFPEELLAFQGRLYLTDYKLSSVVFYDAP